MREATPSGALVESARQNRDACSRAFVENLATSVRILCCAGSARWVTRITAKALETNKKLGRKRSGSLRDAPQQQRTSSGQPALSVSFYCLASAGPTGRGPGLLAGVFVWRHLLVTDWETAYLMQAARDQETINTQRSCLFSEGASVCYVPTGQQINRANADGDVGAKFEEKMLRKDQACEQPS